MTTEISIIYVCIVGVIGALSVWWSRRRIFQTEVKRKSRVRALKRFDPVKTDTPIDTPIEDARETALDSIGIRFSIIRKLSFFFIVSVWLIALIFPFLNEIPAAVVSVFVASSGLIIGVAARPFVENLISGVVISFSRLFRIGDTVIVDDEYGTIEDITMTHVVVKIWNWRRYIVPNGRMLAKEIINCTLNDSFQWSHVEFVVAYDSDLGLVKELAIATACRSRYAADYEDPRFWVMGMEERGYKCWIAAWADSPIDAWELGNDVRTELVSQFRSNGIKTHRFELDFAGRI